MSTDLQQARDFARRHRATLALARAAFQLGACAPGTQQERRSARGVIKAARELNIGSDELLVLFCAEEALKRSEA